MPAEDAKRWNERYRQDTFSSPFSVRPFLRDHAGMLPHEGLAVDVAMGTGANAGFLCEMGLQTVGIDISFVAASRARQAYPRLWIMVADCTELYLPSRTFDVVINFYYLQRNLWPEYRRILKPGGLVVIETLTTDSLAEKPDVRPEFLLNPGELLLAFQKWDILAYREGWFPSDRGHEKAIASLIARIPSKQNLEEISKAGTGKSQ